MYCTLSREPCQHPVVSKKTGHVYEESLLAKHLKQTGKCPVTDEEMSMEDVVPVQGYEAPRQPRAAGASSVPALLRSLQNEWDQVMLESYQLKRHVEQLRQQLSHRAYQYDAACRVIARLTQERDRAIQELGDARQNMVAAVSEMDRAPLRKRGKEGDESGDAEMKDVSRPDEEDLMVDLPESLRECESMSEQLVEHVQKHSQGLAAERKQRKKRQKAGASTTVSRTVLASFSLAESQTLHSSSEPGITCLDIPQRPEMQKYVVTGGVDSTIIVYNREAKAVEHVLRGHRDELTSVHCHPRRAVLVSASKDGSAIVWRFARADDKWKPVTHVGAHEGRVAKAQIHPVGALFATASQDKTWALHSLAGATLCQVENDSPLTSMAIHPDGQLLGTTDEASVVKVWDLRTQKQALELKSHKAPPTCIAFNENGYSLATGDADGAVKAWDLRKRDKTMVHELSQSRVGEVAFDHSGSYLAVGQPHGVEVFECKKWDRVASFRHHSKDVTGIRFGEGAQFVVSASRDRTVKVFSA